MDAKQKWIDENMARMGWTEAEAEEVWNDDHAIDRGESMDFDLTAEQQKAAADITRTSTGEKKTRKATVRTPKIDQNKRDIIQAIFSALETMTENATITKEEREITFVMGDDTYTVTLTKHRKKGGV